MFTLKFSTANAAFDDPLYEIARALRAIARQVETGRGKDGKVTDCNGNTIGAWAWKE
jgi:hypothetical protein